MAVEDKLRTARIVSVVASTAVALSCGTNYVYSAYAPQLAERLHLTTTESNWIGTFGNLGMYLSGIPAGMLVDSKGPRPAIMIGAVSLFVGYYPIYLAFVSGKGSMSVAALCFFAGISGMGSCCAFNASMKAAVLNFPSHRGTASALPLSAFGLSAFFFSLLSSTLFPGDTASFLLLLAIATSSIVFISFFFLRVLPAPNAYSVIQTTRDNSNKLHRTKSGETRQRPQAEPGMNYTTITGSSSREGAQVNGEPVTETSSILSSSSSDDNVEDEDPEICSTHPVDGVHHGYHVDIRGWALTRSVDFWLYWTILGVMTGIGLMTINNIGHSVQALWSKYLPDTDPKVVQTRQAMHVSILSICSFTGRIFAGVSSDILVRSYQAQRFWLVTASTILFCIAQVCALSVETPHWLFLVSGISGLAYGMLFGVYPTIVSEVFGLHGMSQNWGTMTIGAVICGQIFNFCYGRIFDSHSTFVPGRPSECTEGIMCFRDAYFITLFASAAGLVLGLFIIRRNRRLAKGLATDED
ncbi:major facilitator superfamily domain-containing protein [Tirmania nivea]|nr:major facilitator superfamily domain-containing protein [Tirmania nivea]